MSVVYTAAQQRAIDVPERHTDTCVVAGPGSGKTTVLVEYFRRLVESGVDPLRILAITFTEKAAGNMRKKLAEAFQDQPDLRARLERAWVSTVHGFCARLLRENAVFAGLDPEFTVGDERQSWRLQQAAIEETMDALFAEKPALMRSLLRGLSGFNIEEAVLNAYDAMRGAGVTVAQLANFQAHAPVTVEQAVWASLGLREKSTAGWSPAQRQHYQEILEAAEAFRAAARSEEPRRMLEAAARLGAVPKLNKLKRGSEASAAVKELRDKLLHDLEYLLVDRYYQAERELLHEIVQRFDRRYRERKRQAGLVDFSDLEEYAVRLLEESEATRARLVAQFDHVLMDEYQDTNGQQAMLLDLIRPDGRFYAVGDINQSIFGFRHAEPAVFGEHRDAVAEGGGRLVELVDNFRSRAAILRAVETVAAGAEGVEARALVAGRRFAAERECAVELAACSAADADAALAIEAAHVAWRIRELAGPEREHRFRDVAVLVRNTEVIGAFTDAFDLAGVPYVVNRGRGFYASREVNDLTHLLRVIANPRDEVSLAAVLRSPLVAVSDEALLALRLSSQGNLSVALNRFDAARADLFAPADRERLLRFGALLARWRIRRDAHSWDRLLLNAIDECGYPFAAGERGQGNAEKFLAQAREASAAMSIDEFIEELERVRAENPREPDAPPEDASDTVKVMTVHSAKGLEFPVVFVAALHKGTRSDLAAVEFSRRHGLGATWRNPATGESKVDLIQYAIRDERRLREREEGNRLLYVAMTRAEDRLLLSCSLSGRRPENWAETVLGALEVEPGGERDEVVERASPDGAPWRLRVRATAERPPSFAPPVSAPAAGDAARAAELVDRPRDISGQHDGNVTVTAVTAYQHCPRRYYLGHYLGYEGRLRAYADGGAERVLSAGEIGTEVHAILAGAPPPDPDPESVRLAAVFASSALGRRVQRAARVGRECDFLLAVRDVVLRGQIDLWFEEGGELALVDYKTDDVTARQAHERALDYAVQVRLYAMALEQIAGRAPDRAWLHFLRPDTTVEVSLSPSLLDSPEQVVADLAAAQDRLDFPLREGPHCKRCRYYRDLCPAGA